MSAVNQKFSDAARRWRALSENINQIERERLAPQVIAEINQLLSEFGINRNEQSAALSPSLLEHLTQEGIAELGTVLHREHTLDIRAHLESCPTYGAHVAAQSDGLVLENDSSEFACYGLSDIAATPHVIEIANDPGLISLAEQYLGCVPTIYSLNIWWSRPAPDEGTRTTQSFHRDIDDFKFLSLFIYLSDVTMETGPHQYAIGTHTNDGLANVLAQSLDLPDTRELETIQRSPEFSAVLENLNRGQSDLSPEHAKSIVGDNYKSYIGSAGTGLIMSPAGFHKGLTPRSDARLMLWVRYGTHENAAVRKDHITAVNVADWRTRIPDTPKNRYMNRLILNPEG